MCLHPRPVDPVPEETARVARAAFPKGNTLMRMRDELGTIFEDEDFVRLFPRRGQPAMAPWRLALATVMQFAEGLSDGQAADAVRARIDWKYGLSLELPDPGFDASVLCEFRTRLLEGGAERLLFDHLLERFRGMGLVKERGKQRTDSTRILAAARGLNRLELVGEAMRRALDALSSAAPEWLRENVRPEWVRRYVRRLDDEKLPKGKEARVEHGERMGTDGHHLLGSVYSGAAPSWLREIPAVETSRRVWLQNFFRGHDGGVRWRTAEEGIPPSRNFLNSPIDPDCRYARKFTTSWVGYRVHLTETCDDELPSVLTDVRTAPATVPTGRRRPSSTRLWRRRDCSPKPSSWTPATSTRSSCSRARRGTAWTCSVPPAPTTSGRPRRGRASRRPPSPWTGRTGPRPARRARRASAGAPP